MAAELPRPGVEVIQVFRTVSPTVVTPTLVPCIVGVCKQSLNLFTQSASGANQLNSGALASAAATLMSVPATGAPPAFTGLDGLDLVLSVNNGADVTVTFKDSGGLGLSPASIASQLLLQFSEDNVTEAVSGYDENANVFFIRTLGTGPNQTIEIRPGSDPVVLSAFGGADPGAVGWVVGRVAEGRNSYNGAEFALPVSGFPDPKGNLDETVVEPDTVRVFLSSGGTESNIKEMSRSQAHLRGGGRASSAQVTGGTALVAAMFGGGGTLNGTDLTISFDGMGVVTVTLGAAIADAEDLVQRINDSLGRYAASVATVGAADYLRIASGTIGPESSVFVTGGAAAAILGFVPPNNFAVGLAPIAAVDDGDGDSRTPILEFAAENFTAAATAASIIGTKNVVPALASLDGTDLTMSVNGRPEQTMVLGTYANVSELQTAISEFFGTTQLSVTGAAEQTFTSIAKGEESALSFVGGTALPILGIVPHLDALVSAADWRADYDAIQGRKLRMNICGTVVEHTFTGPFGDLADVIDELNGNTLFAAVAVASDIGGEVLRVAALEGGRNAFIQVLAATSVEANYLFGWEKNYKVHAHLVYGGGFPPVSGDDLYVDGSFVGRILKVAPGGIGSRLKLDKEVTVDAAFGDSFYIIAKNLPRAIGPRPELSVDGFGNLSVSPFVVRDVFGAPVMGVDSTLYVTYRAVRQDVTALAKKPGLLRFDSTAQLEAAIEPVAPENPLALGVYFALLNAPTSQVTAIGVDTISADAPFGTVEAFTRAAEFLEAYEVYAIAPLTQDSTVGQVFATHAVAMSEPANKGERLVLFNWPAPDRAVDTLVASGTGDSIGSNSDRFDTGVANLGALLLANGVNPAGTLPVGADVFLDVYSDDKHYNIQSVSGGTVTVRTAFGPGENEDGFYATTVPAGLLVDETFAVRIRGDELVLAGLPDKQRVAETYQNMGAGVQNRRFWNIVPESCLATVGGVEQRLEGFYMCAAISGMIGQNPPQQSFTNFPMTGFTGVVGSNDYFSTKQLNVIAAGGNYIIVQDAQGVPLTSRMALTTDITSVETRTDSIVKVVDYTAKFVRGGLKNFIGRFNITSSFVDTLSHVCQGLMSFLVDSGVLVGFTINNIVQDEDNPDTVLIDITLDVPYPCNYIRLTLVV